MVDAVRVSATLVVAALLLAGCVDPNDRVSAAAESTANAPPPPRKGFQLAIRTGYMQPLGKATAVTGGEMSNYFGWQVPLVFDIGAKVSENIFVGGYLGMGLGPTSGQLAADCSDSYVNVSCYARSMRGGAEVQYHFAPRGRYNFWLGYGLGFEDSLYTASRATGFGVVTLEPSFSGFEFAHLMAGLDFRLSKGIGIGPTVAFTAAQYSTITFNKDGDVWITETKPSTPSPGSITHQSIHEWFLLGARLTLFP